MLSREKKLLSAMKNRCSSYSSERAVPLGTPSVAEVDTGLGHLV
jgi:hypothetical protein